MATVAASRKRVPEQNGDDSSATDGSRPKALPQQPFDDNISVQNIKAYLSHFDGRAKYSELVTFFRRSLTDPSSKARKRADFKDILSKIACFKTEGGEKIIMLRSPSSRGVHIPAPSLQGQQARPISSPEQRRALLFDRRMGSDSSASSQTSLSTCDSGIGLDSQILANNVAARARELGKSTDSLDDELFGDICEDEGIDFQAACSQGDFSEEEKKWMMFATLCDCQQLAAMMDRNPDLPAKRDFVTFTALHWGAKLGRRDMVRLIADTGADINSRTGGQTALHLAAMQGHDIIIKMLINDYGADVHVRDYAGKKPKDLVKDTVAADIQRKLGRSLILDPNTIHLISGVVRSGKDDHFTRIEAAESIDGSVTPETRRRLRTMSFLKKKKKWPSDRNESDDESDRKSRRPKSSIILLTPEAARRAKEQSKSLSSFEI